MLKLTNLAFILQISIEKNKNDVMLCHDCSRDLKQSFIMRSRARKADEQYFNIERKKTSPKQEPTGTPKVVATNTESSKSPAQCKICLKVFPTSKRLAVHTKVVHMKEVHACERCDKKYSSKGNLKRHKLIHIKMSKDESGQNKSQEGPTGESCAAHKTKNRLKSSSKDAGLKDPKVKLRRSKPKDEPAEERCATRKSSKRLKPIRKSPSGDEKSGESKCCEKSIKSLI